MIEYVLYVMSDYYYFIFFFLVIYGVIIYGEIKDSGLFVLQRTTKYGYYYAGKMAAISVFTASIILLHVIIAVLIGLAGRGWGNVFAVPEGQLSEIGLIFQDAFRTPAGALAAVCCYRILGLSLYAGILLLLSHYMQDRIIIVVQTIVYLLTIVTLHKNADWKIPLVFFINYLFLHRALLNQIARYSRKREWFMCVQYSMLLLILFQLGLQCIFTFILGSADTFLGISGKFGSDALPENWPLGFLAAAGFGLRVLELMFLQMLYFLLFSCLNNITASFLLTMSLYLSTVSVYGKWLPFGLSSLCRVIGQEGDNIYWNALVSAVIFIFGYFLIYGCFIKYDVVRKITCGRD